jgi:hypothetical protein
MIFSLTELTASPLSQKWEISKTNLDKQAIFLDHEAVILCPDRTVNYLEYPYSAKTSKTNSKSQIILLACFSYKLSG